ncbi:DUF6210 family protein [Bartonella sp. HY761]|uniref:DUF6210 family protein n=1 Tax=Bartonella sp. HY761 TaxID=2979330 RepID=UPI0021FAAC83|nr:DUF6210 family protein [Bartonella sp. HY761]UXN06331.1 DUF6210 family protein [Bartonella sp. HY761]
MKRGSMQETSYIWYIGDLYLILPNDNGIDYTNQVGGRLKDEMSSKGYLLPLPIFDNLSLKHELLSLFGQSYDGGYLNDHKDIYQRLNLLLRLFALDDSIALDEEKLHDSCNQWIHILIKKPLAYDNQLDCGDVFHHKGESYPIKAILTWSLLYLSDIAPINHHVDIDHLKFDMKIYQSLEARGRDTTSWKDRVLGQQTKQIGKLCRKQMDYIAFETKKILISISLMEELLVKAQALDISCQACVELKEKIAAMKATIFLDRDPYPNAPNNEAYS